MSSRAALAFLLRTVWPGRKRISVWLAALYWSILPTTCSTVVKRVLAWDAGNKAQMAQQTATQANTRLTTGEQVVGNIHHYKTANHDEIRIRPRHTALPKNATAPP